MRLFQISPQCAFCSLVAEGFIIERSLQPAVLVSLDPSQYGFIPGSSTTFALISMFHHWLSTTDGSGATVRTALLDFRKAFDLVNHHVLVPKLSSQGIKPSAVNWIINFLRDQQQRVKLNNKCFSSWKHVPVGVPEGTRLGPWLFLVMINDLELSNNSSFYMWEFADDTIVSEVVLPAQQSHLHEALDDIYDWCPENYLQLSPIKCKELLSCFKKTRPSYDQIHLNVVEFERIYTAKVLGIAILSDFE